VGDRCTRGIGLIGIALNVDQRAVNAVHKAFSKLPGKVYDKAVFDAAGRALAPIRKQARQNLDAMISKDPRNTGQLKKSIGIKKVKYKQNYTVYAAVGPRSGFKDQATGRNPMSYAHLVEYGTRHSAAKPFMTNAYNMQKEQVIKQYTNVLRKKLVRVLRESRVN